MSKHLVEWQTAALRWRVPLQQAHVCAQQILVLQRRSQPLMMVKEDQPPQPPGPWLTIQAAAHSLEARRLMPGWVREGSWKQVARHGMDLLGPQLRN